MYIQKRKGVKLMDINYYDYDSYEQEKIEALKRERKEEVKWQHADDDYDGRFDNE